MKTWDAIIVGGGIIGLSLALELRRQRASVLVIDRTEPGREASWASAGMIAHCDPHLPAALHPLADASAGLYPDFTHEIQEESQLHIDFRREGTIWFGEAGATPRKSTEPIATEDHLAALEPRLAFRPGAWRLPEYSVDTRTFLPALIKVARTRDIDFVTGSPVVELELAADHITGVRTENARYHSGTVVNCAGAWACQLGPPPLPTRPVKGHMLSVVFQHHTPGAKPILEPVLSHVVRAPGVYIVPRSDGKFVIGSTVEDAGFDKRVDPDIVQGLHQAAAILVPDIGEARMHEAWTGLRPGTPDGLPILGATHIAGYFAATGHYRDGIMLAPITARIMSDLLANNTSAFDLAPFSPERFAVPTTR